MTTSPEWPFVVEIKRREKWNLERLKNGSKSPVLGWWAQACKAAAEEKKEALLVFRKSREPWYCMIPESFPLVFQLTEKHEWKKFKPGVAPEVWPVLFKFDTLLEEVDAKSISDGVKKRELK